MPTILVSLWDMEHNEILMPIPFKKTRGKYLYGPEANGKKRKPEALKPSPWARIKDGYADLFNLVRGK